MKYILFLTISMLFSTTTINQDDGSKNYLSTYLHSPDQFDCGGTGGKWVYLKNNHQSKTIKCTIRKTWTYHNRHEGMQTLHEDKQYRVKPQKSIPLGCNMFNNRAQTYKIISSQYE